MLKKTRRANVKEASKNGHIATAPTLHPPQELRRLLGGNLPFNELEEIVAALVATGELEDDALAMFGDVTDNGGAFDQLRYAAKLRRHYVARLCNLAERLKRGDEATIRHVVGNG